MLLFAKHRSKTPRVTSSCNRSISRLWQSGYIQVVRAGDWKLQIDGRQDKLWLFDLATDPTEQNNLAEARPDKLAELTALIDDHQAGSVPPLYDYTIESARAIDKTWAEIAEEGDEYAWWPN